MDSADNECRDLITPVQNVKLYSNEASSNNEIEEQLPQMMKFFDADTKLRVPLQTNVIQYKLDLSEGTIDSRRRVGTRPKKKFIYH